MDEYLSKLEQISYELEYNEYLLLNGQFDMTDEDLELLRKQFEADIAS